MAERQVIGCLVRENELFHRVLSDGRTLDEGLPPAQMTGVPTRRLYARVYERLSGGEPVTLAGLLSELASEADSEELAALARALTDADAEVERAVGEEDRRPEEVLVAAAEACLSFHEQRTYRRQREAMRSAGDERLAAEAGQLLEPLRARPSPVRIARPRT